MIGWTGVLAFFALWILSLAADWSMGGLNHVLLLAGIVLTLFQARQAGQPRKEERVISPRPRPRNRPSSGGRLPADPP